MSFFNNAFRAAILVTYTLAPTLVGATETVWTGTKSFEFYDCKADDLSKITISGEVVIEHPNDEDIYAAPKDVRLICDNIHFLDGSNIQSKSTLDINVNDTASGEILLISTRGVTGEKGQTDPGSLAVRTAANGGAGSPGGPGHNAKCRTRGFKFIREGSTRGGRGGNGGNGAHGGNGLAGADGRAGSNSAHIIFVARNFAEGTRVRVEAQGGRGGEGGKGGRGINGGNGGKGGPGGKGGDAASCKSASDGGDGGTGGNGGNGGNGGRGGTGGNGGNGGNVWVLWQEGQSVDVVRPIVRNEGGTGGAPGSGGEPGQGGAGGEGGNAGCGGSGSGGVLGSIDRKGGGNCRSPGGIGQDGRPGQRGPAGEFGRDGENGRTELPTIGAAPLDRIDALINRGN